MSWYSDGEPFDEWEPIYCKWCTMPGEERTKALCDDCIREHEGRYEEDEDVEVD